MDAQNYSARHYGDGTYHGHPKACQGDNPGGNLTIEPMPAKGKKYDSVFILNMFIDNKYAVMKQIIAAWKPGV